MATRKLMEIAGLDLAGERVRRIMNGPIVERADMIATVLADLSDPVDSVWEFGDREVSCEARAVGCTVFNKQGLDSESVRIAQDTVQGAGYQLWFLNGCVVIPVMLESGCGLLACIDQNFDVEHVVQWGQRLHAACDGAARDLPGLAGAMAAFPAVGRAILVESDAVTHYKRPGSENSSAWSGFDHCDQTAMIEQLRCCSDGDHPHGALNPAWMNAASIGVARQIMHWQRVPFCPELLVGVVATTGSSIDELVRQGQGLCNEILRLLMACLLNSGMKTQIEPFPETTADFERLQEQLRALPVTDLINRLKLGGFATHPVEVMGEPLRCAECIYYLPARRWCDLPALPVPVEAEWFCRLWRL